MSSGLSRRELLLAGGAAWLGAGAMGRVLARPQGATKKVLFFIKSAGFPHSVVTRKGEKPSLAEQILTKAGKEHGFEVVATKDGRMFEPDKIGEWDAFVFETTGDLTTEGTARRARRCRPTARRRSTTPSAAARDSSACTAPPTPSATTASGTRGPRTPTSR